MLKNEKKLLNFISQKKDIYMNNIIKKSKFFDSIYSNNKNKDFYNLNKFNFSNQNKSNDNKLKINISKETKFDNSLTTDFKFNRPLNLKKNNKENLSILHSSKVNGKKLRKKLAEIIKSKGPINLYEYMNICLYNNEYGYYTTKEHIFGVKGDFITAPEISQMFGEMIAIWMFKVLEGFKFPDKFDVVEIGAGRGFMMSDIIRTILTFNRNDEMNFYVVEKSDKLSKIQQDNITNMLMKEKIFMDYNYDKVGKLI